MFKYINRPIKMTAPGEYEEIPSGQEEGAAAETDSSYQTQAPYRIIPSDPPQIEFPDGTRQVIQPHESAQGLYQNWLRGEQEIQPLGLEPHLKPGENPLRTMEYDNERDGAENHTYKTIGLPEDKQLHPIREQYLKDRLEELDRQKRRQDMQDDFTTRMYGKKDLTQEREDILQELQKGGLSFLTKKDEEMHNNFDPNQQRDQQEFWEELENEFNQAQTEEEEGSEESSEGEEESSDEESGSETPKAVRDEIERVKRENSDVDQNYMTSKSWRSIQPNPKTGKLNTDHISEAQMEQAKIDTAKAIEEIKGTGTAYCNLHERLKDLERGIFNPDGELANKRHDRMLKETDKWEKVPRKETTDENGKTTSKLDHDAAYKAAKEGKVVKVSYKNPDPEEHGHITEVDASKTPVNRPLWGGNLPYVDGYNGETDTIGSQLLSAQFARSKEKDMEYFIFKGEPIQFE